MLEVDGLSVNLLDRGKEIPIVTDVSLRLAAGQTLAIVGESGCGKSVLSRAMLGLLSPSRWSVIGSVRLGGTEITGLSLRAMRRIWGREVGMVFQDSASALNPVRTIGAQLTETIRRVCGVRNRTAGEMAVQALTAVGIPDPAARLRVYPHQLSGGMRQRVCIAIALVGEPSLLVADEPTTGLDVTVQEQVLRLLDSLSDGRRMATILVTHDLAVAASHADEIVVLYAGEVVEGLPARSLLDATTPYARALLAAHPRLDTESHARLPTVPGHAPLPSQFGRGCRFAARCPVAQARCAREHPEYVHSDERLHGSRCWLTLPNSGSPPTPDSDPAPRRSMTHER